MSPGTNLSQTPEPAGVTWSCRESSCSHCLLTPTHIIFSWSDNSRLEKLQRSWFSAEGQTGVKAWSSILVTATFSSWLRLIPLKSIICFWRQSKDILNLVNCWYDDLVSMLILLAWEQASGTAALTTMKFNTFLKEKKVLLWCNRCLGHWPCPLYGHLLPSHHFTDVPFKLFKKPNPPLP